MNNQLELNIISQGDCPSFERCKSPLCPIDKSFNKAIWYPDEDICVKRGLPEDIRHIIRTQKKIAGLNKMHAVKGFFTETRLRNTHTVRKGIKGLPNERRG